MKKLISGHCISHCLIHNKLSQSLEVKIVDDSVSEGQQSEVAIVQVLPWIKACIL